MLRRLFTILVLIAVAGWLVLSYLPAGTVTLPQISFASPWAPPWLAVATAAAFVVFAGIQIRLVAATARLFRAPAGSATDAAVAALGLHRGRELFWTALPLAVTVALGLVLLVNR